jgi:hypothetical protein
VFAAIKGAAVGAAAFACVFVFRLGFFIPIVVLLGALAALAITTRERRASRRPSRIVAVAVISFALATSALYGALTNQVSRRAFEMTWSDNGSANRYGDSEVVLEFAKFPGNSVGMFSTPLRDHLSASGGTRTEVEFEVVSDVWCVRGFHEVRIGDLADLSKLKRAGGYARRIGSAPSPWGPRHWWCQ